jgi:hypothetical protein
VVTNVSEEHVSIFVNEVLGTVWIMESFEAPITVIMRISSSGEWHRKRRHGVTSKKIVIFNFGKLMPTHSVMTAGGGSGDIALWICNLRRICR